MGKTKNSRDKRSCLEMKYGEYQPSYDKRIIQSPALPYSVIFSTIEYEYDRW